MWRRGLWERACSSSESVPTEDRQFQERGSSLPAGSAALKVLGPSLRYVSQWHDEASAVLEFEADLGGVYVQGVDILRWNAEGKLVSFTVMVRPLRGLQEGWLT